MRERLTLAFVLVSVILGVSAFMVRTAYLAGEVREHYEQILQARASLVANLVDEHQYRTESLDPDYLQAVLPPDTRVMARLVGDNTVVAASGPAYSGDGLPAGSSEDLWASAETSNAVVTVFVGKDVVNGLAFSDPGSVVLLFVLLAMVAGVVGYLIAQTMSKPFRRLASAASVLGRGRFDLDLPSSSIPEVQAISVALEASATQLRERLSSGQALSEHASHVLRTPLTALRMELEDLSLNEDLPEDAVATVVRSMARIDALDMVTGELAAIARGGSLVAGADISLRELATTAAQRWADELAHQGRTLTAAVEGDLETTYTPGPVEHILELVLVDVLHRGRGQVRMTFEAGVDGHLRISIAAGDRPKKRLHSEPVDSPFKRARAVAAALGGRVEGDDPAADLDIWLPRR
ncbi:MAG: HAMP domain-containing protein [Nocardioides sp.]